jgi:hypothetical protein
MTHYDKLIDSIVEEMWYLWGANTTDWNESDAKLRAHNILKIVEEFQFTRTKLNNRKWRASD